jgi:hypothetical protein
MVEMHQKAVALKAFYMAIMLRAYILYGIIVLVN